MEKYIEDIIVKAQELVDFWYDIGPAGRAIIRKYDYCPEEDVFERYIKMQNKYRNINLWTKCPEASGRNVRRLKKKTKGGKK